MAYGHNSGVDSSGEESLIITLLKNMCVEQQKRRQKESCKRDVFEAAQEERFRLVHEHMNFQETNFNHFFTHATE